jgi:hypothetical protein
MSHLDWKWARATESHMKVQEKGRWMLGRHTQYVLYRLRNKGSSDFCLSNLENKFFFPFKIFICSYF